MSAASGASRVVGVVPWLPWPLSAWRWWTEPVRAERLAALRIGLAGCLLLDILVTYLPNVHTFFGDDALGSRAVFGWLTHSPRLSWSLLRGFGDPLISFLALTGWIIATLWIVTDLVARLLRGSGIRERDPLRYSAPIWCLTGTAMVAGIWSRLLQQGADAQYAWIAPVVCVNVALALLALEVLRRIVRTPSRETGSLVLLAATCLWSFVLVAIGVLLSLPNLDRGSAALRVLSPWQDDATLLGGTMIAWAIVTGMLLLGLWTRPAAIATWALSMSFANLNDSIDNAGDTIRGIILFYLVLCPCGAVWSVDRLWRRWRGDEARILYVPPWPIRLLLIQLAVIYFCNGIYKLVGGSWREGYSLYYVLSDFTLTRISMAQIPLPLWLLRLMTWSVLVWEVTFPLMVMLHRWTRFVALAFGVAFHLGIFFTMELGFFVPYALCMYLPLLPWERWIGPRELATDGDLIDAGEVECTASAGRFS
jgi:uncharacterized membrane protein YphA (DoxX/SURF4 family)